MDWSKEDTLLLIDLMRRRPCLYDKERESYRNSKLKNDVSRELASILSSTRPGTTVQDVLEKWHDLCSKYTSYYKKKLSKKKPSKHFFIDKMQFMHQHLDIPRINPLSKRKSTDENKDINEQVPEMERSLLDMSEFPHLKLVRVETSRNEESSDEVSNSENEKTARPSVSAISIHSDISLSLKNKTLPNSNPSKKKRLSAVSPGPTLHDVSGFTLGSPLVNVSDSILDRTESFPNEYQSYDNDNINSFMSKDASSSHDEEDLLYVKYIACKLNKLEESQKLNFKLKLERLFYESMNN